jgi:molybdopterin synthase catalytic subunit
MGFTVPVHLFATLKDLAGTNRLTITVSGPATIDDVRRIAAEQHPALKTALPSAIAAVNHEYVFAGHPLAAGDEVAFFPPVSGGTTGDKPCWPEVFQLTDQPIDLNTLTASIVSPATGAVALFSGYVRGETQTNAGPLTTTSLEYEAYEPMALTKMKQVAAEIRERWPLVQGIAIVQRIGHLLVGQPTVLIACASGHRDQGCFEAARYGIDRLKEIVPVWKKEIRPDGSAWVEGHYQPTPNDLAG